MITKKTLLVTGLTMLPMLCAMAQWETKPQINVAGSAEVKVVPDEVDLRVSVETRDKELEAATSQNDQRVARSLTFLKELQISDKDIQTDHISIEPVYDERPYISPVTGLPLPGPDLLKSYVDPVYYLVRKNVGIRLTNVAGFDLILRGLITNGVNHIDGIDFRTSELRKYKDAARAMAVKAAKEKAEAMASALGVKIGKPLNISVNDSGGWYGWAPGNGYDGGVGGGGGLAQNASQVAGGGNPDTGPTFAVGQISISASVTVAFLIK